ncbi:MAG: hypothetical protein GXO80_03005 [Chlorobi bacterium]|nr:hypothetical protein [Chlorobiota bacterium]
MKTYFEISLSVYNLWLFTSVFLLLNFGFIVLFPKYNIKEFITVPQLKGYTILNKTTFYLMFLSSIFIPLKTENIFFYIGIVIFVIGIFLYAAAMLYFAISEYHLPVTSGIYKFSRHPVYISFFIIISGMLLVTFSGFLFIIAFLHFYSLYFILNEEEKICEKQYGNLYKDYKQKTRKLI